MLADDVITGLPYLKVEEVRRGHGFEVICRLEKRACCPRCEGEQLRLKDKKLRSIKGITHGNVRTDLLVLVCKYRCQLCGRTFWQEIPGVRKYSRTSQPLKEELFAKSDIVTSHLILSDRSRGLGGAKELGLMKKTA